MMSDLKRSICMSGLEDGVTQANSARMCKSVGKLVKSALVLRANEKWTGTAYVMFDNEAEALATALHLSKGGDQEQITSDDMKAEF